MLCYNNCKTLGPHLNGKEISSPIKSTMNSCLHPLDLKKLNFAIKATPLMEPKIAITKMFYVSKKKKSVFSRKQIALIRNTLGLMLKTPGFPDPNNIPFHPGNP